jgi:hypothetical protein
LQASGRDDEYGHDHGVVLLMDKVLRVPTALEWLIGCLAVSVV